MSRDIRVDTAGARAEAVGPMHGIGVEELEEAAPLVEAGHEALGEIRDEGRQGFFDLYKDAAGLSEVKATAGVFRGMEPENLVVLGIGGSALGTTALVTALKAPYYNLLSPAEREGCPRVFVVDNADPETFAQMLHLCPPEKTVFNVISKSGGTAETVSQLLIVAGMLEKNLGKKALKDHLVITTGRPPRKGAGNVLERFRKQYGLKSLPVPANVEGRFSVFSSVGMFPAAMLGMDLDGFVSGCAAMDTRCQKASIEDNPAYELAVFHYLAWKRKEKSISVMMPYADGLRDVADWYRQLWAESLGKRLSLDGQRNNVFAGQTPVKALGVTDQHSQLQLYLEGPNDKLITVIEVARFRKTVGIPDSMPAMKELDYLRGTTMNKLLASERKATIGALLESNRPVIRIGLPRIDEHTVAQLLYMLEVETAMAGQLFGVNAFDQPAVERIKVLTRDYLGRRR